MNIKQIVTTALNLVIFCLVVGFLLAGYNEVTKDAILANQTRDIQNAQKKLLGFGEDEKLPEPVKVGNLPSVIEASQQSQPVGVDKYVIDGEFVGYVVFSISSGYSSKIQVMYSLSPDYKVQKVEIVSQNETPGLGTRIVQGNPIKQFDGKDFIDQFTGKTVQQLEIGNQSAFNKESIAAITGATISSKAVTVGIRDSLKKLKDELETAPGGETDKRPDGGEAKPEGSESGEFDEPVEVSAVNFNSILFGKPVYAAEQGDSWVLNQLKPLLPGAHNYEFTKLYNYGFEAKKNGKTEAYLITGTAQGHEDVIVIGLAVTPGYMIKNINVISQKESEGYAGDVFKDAFLKQFKGKTIETLVFVQGQGLSDKHIDAVTGASVSSAGVVKAAQNALLYLIRHLEN